MITEYFYHKTVRRAITVFGTLFNRIEIRNTDSDGSTIKSSRVPIAYGPKEKFLSRIEREPEFGDAQPTAIQLPRLSFEITSMTFHPDVAVSMMRRVSHKVNNSEDVTQRTANRSYTGTPYKIGIQLNIMARHQDEVLQILEQIVPYFRPDFLVTVKQVDEMDSIWDMPITLNSISPSVDYEGQVADRRTIIYALDFEVIIRFYGPISNQGIIKKVIANIYDLDGDPLLERIEVEAVPESGDAFSVTTTYTDEFLDE